MFAKLCAKRNKKGFTLAELLIVVAIIAILVAIAIPAYSAQMEKAREAVDRSNARAANSIAVADYLLSQPAKDAVLEYTAYLNSEKGLVLVEKKETAPSGASKLTPSSSKVSSDLVVKVKNGEVTDNSWKAILA